MPCLLQCSVQYTMNYFFHLRRANGGFPGSDIILNQLKSGATKKRVGFLSKGPPARGHTIVQDKQGKTMNGIY